MNLLFTKSCVQLDSLIQLSPLWWITSSPSSDPPEGMLDSSYSTVISILPVAVAVPIEISSTVPTVSNVPFPTFTLLAPDVVVTSVEDTTVAGSIGSTETVPAIAT